MGSGVYQQIINRIPPHDLYVEPFLGGGAILRMKRPAAINIGLDLDPQVINNLPQGTTPNLTLHVLDALDYLKKRTFTAGTFIYCDPPYLFSTRSSERRIYEYELDPEDHDRLLQIIKSLKCMVMISGYPNGLYDDALSSWWTATFQTSNRGHGHVTEKLWMNYPPPIRLHDYRYLGANFRERERIKRKTQRWTRRLSTMPDLERHALAAAIAEIEAGGQHRQDDRVSPATTTGSDGTTSLNLPDGAVKKI
jgi:hypothetical protein